MLGTPRVLNRPGTGLDALKARFPALHDTLEAVSLFVFTPFFLFYGLVPIFGGDGLGLVGADEPRYAQIAREMLVRHDYITPVLWGHPWLEKPALYYWRAMFAFLEFGVHDWSARLPSASFAFILVALIYLHLRRFRPGKPVGCGIDHCFLRRHRWLRPRSLHRYAAGRALLHRHAWAGTPGMRRTRNSGSSTSISSSA